MSESNATRVGVLGLGIIGRAWARNFDADGLLSAAWNRTAMPDFPKWADSPQAVARAADVVIICVANPPAVQEVLDQILPVLESRHTVVQSSTIDPASSERFEQQVHLAGARYAECPFTGSKPAAEARKTVFYMGGEAEVLDALEPLLEHISGHRFRIGSGMQAATLKLAMNMQIAAQAQALCEALALVRGAGIGDDTFFDALRPNVAWSGVTALKEPKLRAGDYSPQFSVKHMLKDMRLALKAWPGAAPRVTSASAACLQDAADHGWADEDFVALFKLLQPGALE